MTAAVTVLKKKQFKSEMKFLVQASRSNAVISANRSAVAAPSQDVTEAQINSEMQLLESEDVIGAVVDPQWSASSRESKSPAEIQEHESKIASFIKHLEMESAHKANVITVTFSAQSPELAANTLDRLSAAYLAERRNITRPPGTSEFYTEESKRYKDAWDHANQELVAFQQSNKLNSVSDVEEGISQQILTTENDLRAAQASSSETDQRVQEATRLVSQVPQRQPTQQKLTPNQGGIEQLQSLLVQLQNRRTELLTRYQQSDRLVTEIDKQIIDTSAALRRMTQNRQSEDTTDVNPAWQQLRTGQVQAIVEKKALQSRIGSLQADLVNLHRQLDQIQPLTTKYNELQEQVDQARNNYQIFSQKRDQSNIEDAMDEHKLVNIAIAENPTMNFTQTAPRPLLYGVLGGLTAVFLAASAVYFAESFRSTIATPRELGAASRYAVLATLPLDDVEPGLRVAAMTTPIIPGDQAPVMGGRSGLIPVMQHLNDAREV
ncbi:MAG TPA: hypothetical protein VGG85_16995 [Terracidiphilus sp.]